MDPSETLAAKPGPGRAPAFSPPWSWEEALAAAGSLACILAAAVLPWASVRLTWRSILFGGDIDLGTYSFKLLEEPWLAAAAIAVAAACAFALFWRRRADAVVIAASLLLLACSAVYLVSLAEKAYDFLGFYNSIMDIVRGLPLVGPALESVIRERLAVSARPHAGLFLFAAGYLAVLSAGLLMRRRNARWNGPRRGGVRDPVSLQASGQTGPGRNVIREDGIPPGS